MSRDAENAGIQITPILSSISYSLHLNYISINVLIIFTIFASVYNCIVTKLFTRPYWFGINLVTVIFLSVVGTLCSECGLASQFHPDVDLREKGRTQVP